MAGAGGSNLTGSLETSAQLQLPHVAHHCCGIKCLLHGEREEWKGEKNSKNLLCLTATEGGKQLSRTK